MAKAPGSLAPRTDCLGQTRTLAGWPSSPGQRNTLWATSLSISQLVSLVREEKETKTYATDYNDEAANINCSNIILAKMSSCQGKCFWTGGRHQEAPTLSCPYIVMFEKRQVLHLGWILFLSPRVNWPSQVSQRDPKNCSPLINFERFWGSELQSNLCAW